MPEHQSIVIIGAGLSGLYTAWCLQQQRQDIILLEASDRAGGRIRSLHLGGNSDSCVDLGPAWLWPQFQSRLEQLISEFKLGLFKQYTRGEIIYESASEQFERYPGPSAHNESWRIAGGAQKLIEALQSRLPASAIRLNTQVTSIQKAPLSVQALHEGKFCTYSADKIVLALPPRVTQQNIEFNPPLPDEIQQLWQQTSTWMAAQSKMLFIYDRPFWRDQNLSAEVFSQRGPLTEIYDGSPANEEFYALTSFVGLPVQQRHKLERKHLIELCLSQLQRLFGEASQNPIDIQIKDWSQDRFISTDTDLNTASRHPDYPGNLPRNLWENKLILAGTEVARQQGGYLEGALESADEAISLCAE
jgi:monoamine oxidase